MPIPSNKGPNSGTVQVIINPAAGSGHTRERWPGAIVALREAGLRPEYVLTESAGHAIALAQQAGLDGYDAVIAMGGDGTAHEVANGLLQVASPPPLALLQTGTGRDLSRLLALPDSLEAQARLIARGETQRIDVGYCRHMNADQIQEERAFLLLAGAGFTSAVIDRSLGLKRWLGGPAYFAAAILELFRAQAAPARLTLDGAAEQVAVVEMMVLNAPWVGGGMYAGPGANAQDGWLEVLIVQEMSRWRLLNVVLRVYRGAHIEQPGIRYGTTKQVVIEPEVTMPVSVDGEVVGQTPAEFWVAPEALTVVAGEVRSG